MGFLEPALRTDDGKAFLLLKFFHHVGLLAVRTGFGHRFFPGGEFTIRVLTATIKGSALFGSSWGDFSLAALHGGKI